MRTSSNDNNSVAMDEIFNDISSYTGLSKNEIDKIIDKNLLLSTATFDDYSKAVYEYFFRNQKMLNVNDFRDLFSSELSKTRNKQTSINTVLQHLDANIETTDTLSVLSTIKDLLIIDNNSDAEKLYGLLSIVDNNVDITSLNESSDFNFDNEQVDYGLLKEILTKNNRRWNLCNDTTNTYQQILAYVDDKIKRIGADVVTFDSGYQLNLIKEYCSGVVSPLNLNYSTNKHLVNNIQSLVFDMIVLTHSYFNNMTQFHDFVSLEKINTYHGVSNKLVAELYSSLFETTIINKHFIEDVANGKFDGDGSNYSLLDNLASLVVEIDTAKLRGKQISTMLFYMSSASFDFNLKIRPMLKLYINTTLEIVKTLENVKLKVNVNKTR